MQIEVPAMKQNLKNIHKNIIAFRKCPYTFDLSVRLIVCGILWCMTLSTCCMLISLHRRTAEPERFIPFWIFLILSTGFVLTLLYWYQYYQIVILSTQKMENIKDKYSLIDAQKMTDYVSSLQIVLELIDDTLEKEYSIRMLQKQTELDSMQSQINPHFLYNTMDTIRGYAIMEDAPITSDMIEVLSRLFRYMISQKNAMTTIRQEISILYDYIKIQEYRMNQHIILLQNIENEAQVAEYSIPKLIIQPLIENSIKHGNKNISREFIITLNIYYTQSRLIISVADNGCGMTPQTLNKINLKLADNSWDSVHTRKKDELRGNGIALTNINSRIRLLYGESYGLTAYSTIGRGSEFQITLPFHIQE